MSNDCPVCGGELLADDEPNCSDCLWTPNDDPRDRLDDDGREYADPRDYRDGLE